MNDDVSPGWDGGGNTVGKTEKEIETGLNSIRLFSGGDEARAK